MFLDKFLELGNFEQTSIRISDFSHDILQTTNVQKLESLSTNSSSTVLLFMIAIHFVTISKKILLPSRQHQQALKHFIHSLDVIFC